MLVPRLWLLLTSAQTLYFFSRLGHAGTETMASSHLGTEPLLFLRALVMLVLRQWLLSPWHRALVFNALVFDAPQSIYNMNVGVLSTAAKVVLPSGDVCKRTIRRNRTNDYPPEPASLAELEIEEPWSLTAGDNPEDFVFFDNGPGADSRIIAFATEDDLRRLAASEKWFMDGNFSMAPPHFLQLYVIHVPLVDSHRAHGARYKNWD